jgi:hypothetical protein
MALGGVMRKFLPAMLIVCVVAAGAREIEKVNFPETIKVSGQTLQLNGVGLRTKRRFVMNFRVYVAGLYAKTKSADPAALIASDLLVLHMRFLRSLNVATLREAWSEGYGKNCGADCAATAESLKLFNEAMVDVGNKSQLTLRFEKEAVQVEMDGKWEKRSARIENAAFRRGLLSVFIGAFPPTEELKNGLLGNKVE